jgi:pseudouridine-5'-phosphate glycosidase
VVALETTLVSHGFPPGRGATVARDAEAAVCEAGATAAAVGLIEGQICVGLAGAELADFSTRPDTRKIGALVSGEPGATTVGATLAVCEQAGLSTFATGGIGGVHRGYAALPDISSNLRKLTRAKTVIVCSGMKSLLDVEATNEALESLGVPVLGWRTDTLPLFYSRDGGPTVERVETAAQVARLASAHWSVGGRAIVVARPPDPQIPVADAQLRLDAALSTATREELSGGALTPFVLDHVHRASDGRTLEVNHRLIVDNAALAGQIAVALSTEEHVT